MILKLNKHFHKLKIGIVGARSRCFANVLDKEKIKYNLIKVNQIDESYDLIFESGLYRIIPKTILKLPKLGVFGIHETPLPEGRGFAPLQWSILNKREHLVVTFYKLDEDVDNGMIVSQSYQPIDKTDTINILDEKRKKGIEEAFQIFIDELKQGYIVLRNQTGKPSYSARRTPESCELNIEKKLVDLWDEIRICDNEKYPAWFTINDKKITIRYEINNFNRNKEKP